MLFDQVVQGILEAVRVRLSTKPLMETRDKPNEIYLHRCRVFVEVLCLGCGQRGEIEGNSAKGYRQLSMCVGTKAEFRQL